MLNRKVGGEGTNSVSASINMELGALVTKTTVKCMFYFLLVLLANAIWWVTQVYFLLYLKKIPYSENSELCVVFLPAVN